MMTKKTAQILKNQTQVQYSLVLTPFYCRKQLTFPPAQKTKMPTPDSPDSTESVDHNGTPQNTTRMSQEDSKWFANGS